MKQLETWLSDLTISYLDGHVSRSEVPEALAVIRSIQGMSERSVEAGLRKTTARVLLSACTVVLFVSLVLVTCQAFGLANLPAAAITTLVGSIPIEFIGMFTVVVRYLFPEGGLRE